MMHQQWTVLCDAAEYIKSGQKYACCASDQVSGTKRQACNSFVHAGWKRKARGKWLCPSCAAEGCKGVIFNELVR